MQRFRSAFLAFTIFVVLVAQVSARKCYVCNAAAEDCIGELRDCPSTKPTCKWNTSVRNGKKNVEKVRRQMLTDGDFQFDVG